MPGQARGVGSESVGFNNFRSCLQILVMDLPDHVRLRAVQLVITSVDEYALGVQKRAHGAVAQHRSLLQPGKKLRGHVEENTRFGQECLRDEVMGTALIAGS